MAERPNEYILHPVGKRGTRFRIVRIWPNGNQFAIATIEFPKLTVNAKRTEIYWALNYMLTQYFEENHDGRK